MMEGVPFQESQSSDVRKPSDRLPKQTMLGLCPTFDEVRDEDNLQTVLQGIGLSVEDFQLVLQHLNIHPTQIAVVMSSAGYKFSIIKSQSIMSGNIRKGFEYLRDRTGKTILENTEKTNQGPKDLMNPPSGSYRLPGRETAEQLDLNQKMSELGFNRDELIGGIMAVGAIQTAPSMVQAFWDRGLFELKREAPQTYDAIVRFLKKNASAIASTESVVREEVRAAVSSDKISGVDTVSGGELKVSDLTAYMAQKGIPIPPKSETALLNAQASAAHEQAQQAIAEMKSKIDLQTPPASNTPGPDSDVKIQ